MKNDNPYKFVLKEGGVLSGRAVNSGKTISGKVTIPSEIDGEKVLKIERLHHFGDDTEQITELIIPEGVTEIGYEALYDRMVDKVVLPSTIEHIDTLAFSSCGLKSVVFPKKVSSKGLVIGESAFSYNKVLTSVELPDGVSIIKKGGFYACKLTSIKIPSSVKVISTNAFSENSLKLVEFENGIDTIDEGAFSHNNLDVVVLPPSIRTFSDTSFASWDCVVVYPPNTIIGGDSNDSSNSDSLNNSITYVIYRSEFDIEDIKTLQVRVNKVKELYDLRSGELSRIYTKLIDNL